MERFWLEAHTMAKCSWRGILMSKSRLPLGSALLRVAASGQEPGGRQPPAIPRQRCPVCVWAQGGKLLTTSLPAPRPLARPRLLCGCAGAVLRPRHLVRPLESARLVGGVRVGEGVAGREITHAKRAR